MDLSAVLPVFRKVGCIKLMVIETKRFLNVLLHLRFQPQTVKHWGQPRPTAKPFRL
jgi:hypothetical protein